MTPNFRLRPKPVHAVRFDPEVQPWPEGVWHVDYLGTDLFFLGKPHEYIIVRPGDWLVTDELGTRIVRHEAFDLLYEEVKAIESCI